MSKNTSDGQFKKTEQTITPNPVTSTNINDDAIKQDLTANNLGNVSHSTQDGVQHDLENKGQVDEPQIKDLNELEGVRS